MTLPEWFESNTHRSEGSKRIVWTSAKARTPWSAAIVDDSLVITAEQVVVVDLANVGLVHARHGLISSEVRVPGLPPLQGMKRRDARAMASTLQMERDRVVAHRRVEAMRANFRLQTAQVRDWAAGFFAAAKAADSWLTNEFVTRWRESKPGGQLAELLLAPELQEERDALGGDMLEAMDLWNANLDEYTRVWNERFTQAELLAHRSFFEHVERSPLSEEQARAVVCFDNRVQLVASAGSGKTSTMVAKAGYAIHRGIAQPEQIAMLAFNSAAAAELQQRVRERLGPLGLGAESIVTSTFHGFGLAIIGKATGRKPSLAPWLESGEDIAKIAQIVEHLRDANAGFRAEWDLFRIVLGRDLPEFGEEESEPDAWDPLTRRGGFRTLAGEVVRSQGERLIADWLFYNGIEYVYERRYEVDVADSEQRQYQPDFYYPQIATYHEHLALDQNGNPPESFTGYLDGVAWKRAVHAANNTALIETTMAQVWDGSAFFHLTEELVARGLHLDPDPDRPAVGQARIDDERLLRTLRAFMIHAKSNRLTIDQLAQRVRAESPARFQFRHEMFLRLYATIQSQWEEELHDSDSIDFEDMLNLAADHVEAGNWVSPFRLVMVDEMQDASYARARLARALTRAPAHHLFAVGDDWQSINRFAGADLSVMTGFEEWFGKGQILRLERTFRSPQSLCTVAGRFVGKNPEQLVKHVVSSTPEFSPSVSALAVADEDRTSDAIRRHLTSLNARLSGSSRVSTVFLLGRYRHQEALMPSHEEVRGWKNLSLRFSTIHGSKGLEADHVLIAGLVRDRSAFPSRASDDPVLRIAMPAREVFPHAEERRLLYVALTRARRSAVLLSVENRESPFLLELIKESGIPYVHSYGEPAAIVHCPSCETGVMVPRKGKNGRFYGCSNFPRCTQTMKQAHRD